MSKKLKIKILTVEPFPLGMAATNRILTYAKGFLEQNCIVEVNCIKPTERPGKIFNHKESGTLNGIKFSYPGGKTILDQNFITRRFDNIKSILRVSIILLKENKEDKTDAIIYYATSTSRAIILFLITRMKGILFLKEESELPEIYLPGMNIFQKLLFQNIHYSLFDGYFLMTRRLIKYFTLEKNTKIPYLHVPMTVDFNRFEKKEKLQNGNPYIAYCGSLNKEKDGVDLLIDGFALIAKEFPNILLYLIGSAASSEEETLFEKKIRDYRLSERIILTGRISKDEIPKYLCNAKFLILPRPANPQTEAGFPTKLGEYLSTGSPVVVTRVGEIPDYLTNKENVFMAEPGNIASLVVQMRELLLNYPRALEIGRKGKEVVIKNFNYQIQTKEMVHFIKSLKNNGTPKQLN